MYKTLRALLVITFAFKCSLLKAEIIAFENVNLITMEEDKLLHQYRVITDDDKIVDISPMAKPGKIIANRIINCAGKYLMPGLTDAHFHPRGAKTLQDMQLFYKLLIANGITTVVSMGEDAGQDAIATREYANNKSNLAPFYFTAGPLLGSEDLKTPADAITTVKYHKKRGYDFIKVHEDFPKEVYFTLLREAQQAGIPVVGHAQRSLPLEYSLRLNLIVHMEEIVDIYSDMKNFLIADITAQQARDIAAQVKASGIYISPTLTVLAKIQDYRDDGRFNALKSRSESRYLTKQEFENYTTEDQEYRQELFKRPNIIAAVDLLVTGTQTLTKAFYEAGVSMLVGSDNIGLQVTGFSIHEEMEAMNKAGMSTFAVLNSATLISARYLKRQAIAGTISVGKNAEFILLAENPLSDIRHTRNLQGVMLKGKWFDKKALEQMLVDVENGRREK
ncbi:MAG: amidohydrolase family protein [Pseudomonadota bacterium]